MGRVILAGIVTGFVALALSTKAIADLQVVVRGYVPHAGLVGHFGLFVALGLTLGWVAGRAGLGRMVVWCTALGLGLELVQGYLPGRAVEVEDIAANVAGGWIGLAMAWIVVRIRDPVP